MESFAPFARLVHEAYARLHDRAYLQEHPLAELLGRGAPLSAERLYRALTDAIEWLRPLGAVSASSVEWRRYRHLRLRYLEGARPDEIERELAVSARQARRDHADAIDEVARLLWRRLVEAERGEPPAPAAPDADLDAELTKLAALEAAPARAEEVVAGVVETIRPLADEHGAALDVATGPPLPPVDASRTLVRQLLLNLLTEAIVGSPGHRLSLALAERAGSVELLASLGPPTDRLAAEVASWRRLVAGRGIVLELEPTAGGGVLRVALPAVPPTTLLVVDDNPDVGYLFQRYLAGAPYRVLSARTGERALRLAREARPDAVFLDVLMPAQDGWEILRALRAEPATADLPVVVCSVLPDRPLARSLGVSDFLSKPVTRGALLEMLGRLPRRPAGARPDQP